MSIRMGEMGHRAATTRPIELAVVVTPTNEWVSYIPLAAGTAIKRRWIKEAEHSCRVMVYRLRCKRNVSIF